MAKSNIFILEDYRKYKRETKIIWHEPSFVIVFLYRIRKQMTKFPKVLLPIKFILLLFMNRLHIS